MSSGIYILLCKTNKKFYIGSAVNLERREMQHFAALRSRRHYNKYLQRVYDKYGEDTFEFRIIMRCEPDLDMLLIYEQQYLDAYWATGNLYNISKDALAAMSGRSHSQETKDKIRMSDRVRERSEETRKRMRKLKFKTKKVPRIKKTKDELRDATKEIRERLALKRTGQKLCKVCRHYPHKCTC